MYSYFQQNDLENAAQFFDSNKFELDKHPVANYLMSFVAESRNEIREARTFIRKSIMSSQSFENVERYKKRLQELLWWKDFCALILLK